MSNNTNGSAYYNCVFFNNTSGSGGGFYSGTTPTVTNCTFYNNTTGNGGGIWVNHGMLTLTNSILTHNSSNLDTSINGSSKVSHSIVGGGQPGTQIIDEDPLFEDPLNDNFKLLGCSPAINAGINDSIPTGTDSLDACDSNRLAFGTVDIGAFEYQFPKLTSKVVHVDSTAGVNGSGNNWITAIPDLRRAITLGVGCEVDTIKLAEGSYYPDTSFILDQLDSLFLIGGYPQGGGTNNPSMNKTVLNGNIGSRLLKQITVITCLL